MDDPASFHDIFPLVLPDRDSFADRLFQMVSSCFMVVGRRSQRLLGVAYLYRWSGQHGLANFHVSLKRSARGSGVGVEAAYLFVTHIFSSFNIRKLYLEAGAWQAAEFGGAIGGVLREEGRLRNHRSFRGRWHDHVFLSLDRDTFCGHEGGLRGLLAERKRSGSSNAIPNGGSEAQREVPSGASSRWKALGKGVSSLESARVRLVPILSRHLKYLYGLNTAEDVGHRWRFGGAVPTVQEFQRRLNHGVFVQFISVVRRNGQPFGHLVAYDADPLNGHVYIGGVTESRLHRTGYPIDGFVILMRYLFGNWGFRKIYMDLPEYNRDQLLRHGMIEGLKEEARLLDVTYHNGSWWDRSILAIDREIFMISLGLNEGG
jgi:RimJ/RimL family protein N-acetyltransferase